MRKKQTAALAAIGLSLIGLLTSCASLTNRQDESDRYFTDQYHADLDYSEMAYERFDENAFREELDAVRALIDDPANADEVDRRMQDLEAEYLHANTMTSLAFIQVYRDVTDEAVADEYEYCENLMTELSDSWLQLMRDALASPCGDPIRERLTEEDLKFYSEYEDLPEEVFALSARETALINEYQVASSEEFTVSHEGQELTTDDAYDAYLSHELTYSEFSDIYDAIQAERNQVLGDIYIELVGVRKDIAKAMDYDNYVDYAYEKVYMRDYTKEDIRSYQDGVKKYIMPVYQSLNSRFYREMDSHILMTDYSGEAAFDTMEPYIAEMSEEMLEAFHYMREHHLYDTDVSDTKYGTAFTTMLSSYGAPFLFNNASGDVGDLSTAVHEFGHYNQYYWHPAASNERDLSYDLAEVHSQALELLFSEHYPRIFGRDSQVVTDSQLTDILYSIFTGSFHDELQQYVYSTDNVTREQINEEYNRLCEEYGIAPGEEWDWVEIPHTFEEPCYYISYSVSASGALAFWLEAQKDYEAAVDTYLRFTALSPDTSFQECFDIVGLDNPLTPEYLEMLADTLTEELDL